MDKNQVCPLCQLSNHCGVNNPAGCWCFNTNIPQALLDIVPACAKGNICICAQCVFEFNQDSEGFIDKHSRSLGNIKPTH